MSYQIKSTPLYRSIVSKSMKSGELQRLREEFERMRDFTDRTIEMKMRQVRLKRLFREIEDIKETRGPAWRRRRANAQKPKTPDQIRFETLMRAKELGKEYSKLNAIMVERSNAKFETLTGPYPYPEVGYSIGALSSKLDVERKARSVKRINYGNEISRSNMRKITRAKRRHFRLEQSSSITYQHSETKSESELQLQKLRQRLDYGNSWSTINMAKHPQRYRKAKRTKPTVQCAQALDSDVCNGTDTNTLTAEESSLLSNSETNMFDRYLPRQLSQNLSDYISDQDFEVPPLPLPLPEEHGRARALKNWRRLVTMLRTPCLSPSATTTLTTEEEPSLTLLSARGSCDTQLQMPIPQANSLNQVYECNSGGLERPCIRQNENLSCSSNELPVPGGCQESAEKPSSRVKDYIKKFEMSSKGSTSSKEDYVLADNKLTGIFKNTQ